MKADRSWYCSSWPLLPLSPHFCDPFAVSQNSNHTAVVPALAPENYCGNFPSYMGEHVFDTAKGTVIKKGA